VTSVDDVVRLLGTRRLACAESVTGGLLAQCFAAAEGSMQWFPGGVVTYQRRAKERLLHLPPVPVVSREAAAAMATGAAELFDAHVAVSVTGAAGPDPLEGAEPGTVVVGTSVDGVIQTFEHHFTGAPPSVCIQARDAALADVYAALQVATRDTAVS
jgi:nicotinamide-nucleotide amidase